MRLKGRITTVLSIACIVGGMYGAACLCWLDKTEDEMKVYEDNTLFGHRDTLYLWYTDEALTDYLNSVVVSYS